jgi:hypothetical protein
MALTITVSEVREIYPQPEGAAVQKRWRKLDRFMRAFIKRSPFLCLGTTNAAGKADVSPAATRPALCKSSTTRPCSFPIDRGARAFQDAHARREGRLA